MTFEDNLRSALISNNGGQLNQSISLQKLKARVETSLSNKGLDPQLAKYGQAPIEAWRLTYDENSDGLITTTNELNSLINYLGAWADGEASVGTASLSKQNIQTYTNNNIAANNPKELGEIVFREALTDQINSEKIDQNAIQEISEQSNNSQPQPPSGNSSPTQTQPGASPQSQPNSSQGQAQAQAQLDQKLQQYYQNQVQPLKIQLDLNQITPEQIQALGSIQQLQQAYGKQSLMDLLNDTNITNGHKIALSNDLLVLNGGQPLQNTSYPAYLPTVNASNNRQILNWLSGRAGGLLGGNASGITDPKTLLENANKIFTPDLDGDSDIDEVDDMQRAKIWMDTVLPNSSPSEKAQYAVKYLTEDPNNFYKNLSKFAQATNLNNWRDASSAWESTPNNKLKINGQETDIVLKPALWEHGTDSNNNSMSPAIATARALKQFVLRINTQNNINNQRQTNANISPGNGANNTNQVNLNPNNNGQGPIITITSPSGSLSFQMNSQIRGINIQA